MDSNYLNNNIQNSFSFNQREQNSDPALNSFNPENLIDLQNTQIHPDLNNQILNPFQPNEDRESNNQQGTGSEKEKQDEYQNEETSQNKGTNSENKKSPKAGKRRSKSEIEGRTFECKLCNKSYLSYPALYTHCKQKHNKNNSSGRGRGRPKKEGAEFESEKIKFNPINSTYFMKEERNGKTQPDEINNCIDEAFKELYSEEYRNRNQQREMKNYNSVEEHPFLYLFKNDAHDLNQIMKDGGIYTDKVLINYLNKMSQFCNPKFYIKLIKFITLFREHVNLFNRNKVEQKVNGIEKEYTEIFDAEDVPDSSNEFITDFLDPTGKNEDFGYSREECIDLTQNLCFWMYDNNFTCSKLSLIHNEK